MLFLGAMRLLFAVAVVSGVAIHLPYTAHLPFGTIRRARRRLVRRTGRHSLLGVATVPWAAVVGLTGAVDTLVAPVTSVCKADRLAALSAPYAGRPVARASASVDAAVATAMAAAPGISVQFVAFPGVAFSRNHHLAVFSQGETPLTKILLASALIDARTGRWRRCGRCRGAGRRCCCRSRCISAIMAGWR